MIDGGVILIKLWMEVSNEEQKRRFEARIQDRKRRESSARWTFRHVRAGTTTPAPATSC